MAGNTWRWRGVNAVWVVEPREAAGWFVVKVAVAQELTFDPIVAVAHAIPVVKRLAHLDELANPYWLVIRKLVEAL